MISDLGSIILGIGLLAYGSWAIYARNKTWNWKLFKYRFKPDAQELEGLREARYLTLLATGVLCFLVGCFFIFRILL